MLALVARLGYVYVKVEIDILNGPRVLKLFIIEVIIVDNRLQYFFMLSNAITYFDINFIWVIQLWIKDTVASRRAR